MSGHFQLCLKDRLTSSESALKVHLPRLSLISLSRHISQTILYRFSVLECERSQICVEKTKPYVYNATFCIALQDKELCRIDSMEVIKKKASEDYIRTWEANTCLENLFGTQQRQVRVCEALREPVMYEPQPPGIKGVEKILGGADPWDLGRRRERGLPARGEHRGAGRETPCSETQEGCATRPRHCRGLRHTEPPRKTRGDRRDSPGFAEGRMKTSSGIYLRQPALHPSRHGAGRARLRFSKRTNSLTNCCYFLSPPNLVFVTWKLLQFSPRRCLKRASTAASPACPKRVVSGALPHEPGVLPLTNPKGLKLWAIIHDGVLGNSDLFPASAKHARFARNRMKAITALLLALPESPGMGGEAV